jgi:hypothetical protein
MIHPNAFAIKQSLRTSCLAQNTHPAFREQSVLEALHHARRDTLEAILPPTSRWHEARTQAFVLGDEDRGIRHTLNCESGLVQVVATPTLQVARDTPTTVDRR